MPGERPGVSFLATGRIQEKSKKIDWAYSSDGVVRIAFDFLLPCSPPQRAFGRVQVRLVVVVHVLAALAGPISILLRTGVPVLRRDFDAETALHDLPAIHGGSGVVGITLFPNDSYEPVWRVHGAVWQLAGVSGSVY